MTKTLIVSTEQLAPSVWQGCLRDPSFKILWRCPHKHACTKDAIACATEERERRQPTPVYTGLAPAGATHITRDGGTFCRPDDENYLIQVYRRGRWVADAMHASNLDVSRAYIAVKGAPAREAPEERAPIAPRETGSGHEQQAFDFGLTGEVAA